MSPHARTRHAHAAPRAAVKQPPAASIARLVRWALATPDPEGAARYVGDALAYRADVTLRQRAAGYRARRGPRGKLGRTTFERLMAEMAIGRTYARALADIRARGAALPRGRTAESCARAVVLEGFPQITDDQLRRIIRGLPRDWLR